MLAFFGSIASNFLGGRISSYVQTNIVNPFVLKPLGLETSKFANTVAYTAVNASLAGLSLAGAVAASYCAGAAGLSYYGGYAATYLCYNVTTMFTTSTINGVIKSVIEISDEKLVNPILKEYSLDGTNYDFIIKGLESFAVAVVSAQLASKFLSNEMMFGFGAKYKEIGEKIQQVYDARCFYTEAAKVAGAENLNQEVQARLIEIAQNNRQNPYLVDFGQDEVVFDNVERVQNVAEQIFEKNQTLLERGCKSIFETLGNWSFNVFSVTRDFISSSYNNTLGPVLNPVLDGLSSSINYLYDYSVSPILEGLKTIGGYTYKGLEGLCQMSSSCLSALYDYSLGPILSMGKTIVNYSYNGLESLYQGAFYCLSTLYNYSLGPIWQVTKSCLDYSSNAISSIHKFLFAIEDEMPALASKVSATAGSVAMGSIMSTLGKFSQKLQLEEESQQKIEQFEMMAERANPSLTEEQMRMLKEEIKAQNASEIYHRNGIKLDGFDQCKYGEFCEYLEQQKVLYQQMLDSQFEINQAVAAA